MQLLNLQIDRIVIHQIFPRESDGSAKAPIQSHQFINFDSSALEEFKTRVRDALGNDSKAVQMEIVDQAEDSTAKLVDRIVGLEDEDFIVSSFDFAQKLNRAQSRKGLPGGIVVVFSGTHGFPAKKFLGIIKAEVHSVWEKLQDPKTNEISLKFVKEALLTPGNRLYKTVGFYEVTNTPSNEDLNSKWTVMIADSQIGKIDGKAAAKYFYEIFLGFGYLETSARTTKMFYDSTFDFIKKLDIPPEKKTDLYNALTTYLKTDTSTVVNANSFAETYFEPELVDIYRQHCTANEIPLTSFTKDTEHVASKLKKRKVKFDRDISFYAPADAFDDLVEMTTIENEDKETGASELWTNILVKTQIRDQE